MNRETATTVTIETLGNTEESEIRDALQRGECDANEAEAFEVVVRLGASPLVDRYGRRRSDADLWDVFVGTHQSPAEFAALSTSVEDEVIAYVAALQADNSCRLDADEQQALIASMRRMLGR